MECYQQNKENLDGLYLNYIGESNICKNNDIDDYIELTLKDVRSLYWRILEDTQKSNDIKCDNLGVLEKIKEYVDLSICELNKNEKISSEYLENKNHINSYHKARESGNIMKSIIPILSLADIKNQWINFKEINISKVIFTGAVAVINYLLGTPSTLVSVLFFMTILGFIMRCLANRYKLDLDYINFYKNIQLFLWPYVLVAIAKQLNRIIALNGLPENTFLALVECWVVWGELKSVVENAKVCGLPIPKIIENIVVKGNDDKTFLPF